MAREVSARDLQVLGDERFEQLVASIVLATHPDAERPVAPDGGADVLLPATPSRRARVWQVKHYPGSIAWKKCETSLDDAVAAYDPEAVVFVFPRNLSQPLRATFNSRLVKREPNVDVSHWGLQRIQDELARYPDIRTRYFGEDRGDLMPGLIRAMQQGGRELENTRDLVDRAFGLDEFANTADPSFSYEMSVGSADLKERLWEDPPFMVIHETRGDRRVSAEAWLRPEARANASFGFTDDDAGELAREQVRRALAAGQPVEITEGLWSRVENPPVAVREAVSALEAGGYQVAHTICPGRSVVDLSLEFGDGPDAENLHFAARGIPPPKGFDLSVGCIANGLSVFIDVKHPPSGGLSIGLHVGAEPVHDAATGAAAARSLLAFFAAEKVVCKMPELLPVGGLPIVAGARTEADARNVERLKVHSARFDALVLVEERFGPVDITKTATSEQVYELLTLAGALRAGGGQVSFQELIMEVEDGAVESFIRDAQAGHPDRHHLPFNVLGRQVHALAEFNTPPVRLVTTERGSAPGMTRVRLRTDPINVPFRFVDEDPLEPPPASPLLWTPGNGPSGLVPPV